MTARRSRSTGFRRLAKWPRERKLRMTLSHRGGAESWWLVEARGTQAAFPGWMSLEDVMSVVLTERR